MNTTMADGASERLDAQIADALFRQPGMSKLDVANRLRQLRGDRGALLGSAAYPAAWLRAHPYSSRVRSSLADHQAKALKIGGIAVYSILRDWVKGQVTAIEIGMLTFEAAFLSHILLSSGQMVIEHVQHQKLLPQEQTNA